MNIAFSSVAAIATITTCFATTANAQGLEVGQEATTFANLDGFGGLNAQGFYAHSPGAFGAGPGTASATRTRGGTPFTMSYNVSGHAEAQPFGAPGTPLRLRASAHVQSSVVGPWTGPGTARWSVSSIATAADRFTIPWVADGSTTVTLSFEGHISGTQTRASDASWNSAYLIGNPGLGSQTTVWQNVLNEGDAGPDEAIFNNVPFSFSTTIGVDPWGWVTGLQLIAGAGTSGGTETFTQSANTDFGSTIVVDRLVVRSGLTGAILNPNDFGFSAQSGIDYTPFIVPSPSAAGLLALGGLAAARRRR
ncbi:MAG: hypothetical protein NTV94_15240 [Planctomycetota bacterium]|nr:hypothetical protein [Planctomycetota bacterium]